MWIESRIEPALLSVKTLRRLPTLAPVNTHTPTQTIRSYLYCCGMKHARRHLEFVQPSQRVSFFPALTIIASYRGPTTSSLPRHSRCRAEKSWFTNRTIDCSCGISSRVGGFFNEIFGPLFCCFWPPGGGGGAAAVPSSSAMVARV